MGHDWAQISPQDPTQFLGPASAHPPLQPFSCFAPETRWAFLPAHQSRPSCLSPPDRDHSFTQRWRQSSQGPEQRGTPGGEVTVPLLWPTASTLQGPVTPRAATSAVELAWGLARAGQRAFAASSAEGPLVLPAQVRAGHCLALRRWGRSLLGQGRMAGTPVSFLTQLCLVQRARVIAGCVREPGRHPGPQWAVRSIQGRGQLVAKALCPQHRLQWQNRKAKIHY